MRFLEDMMMQTHKPRYVYFGTPGISRIVLTHLLDAGLPPLALVANPDRPTGRKKVMSAPETKLLLAEQKLSLPVFQPEKAKDVIDDLKKLNPDFFVVMAYAKILPQALLDIPTRGSIGIHPSLLPAYRGPSPFQSAILDGAPLGVSLYFMDKDMDAGPIILESPLADPGDLSYAEASEKLGDLGGELIVRVFQDPSLQDMTRATPQDGTKATYTKKFSSEDGFIDPETLTALRKANDPLLALRIHRKILAFTPEPGAWTLKDTKRVKLLHSSLLDGRLQITEIQYEGKKPQKVKGFEV
jgi:methionyl-tRNA formyltransferase